MPPEAWKMLPDSASVVAVIAVVVIFLKYQRDFNTQLQNIAIDFTKKVDDIQKNCQAQLDRLTQNYLNSEKVYQAQIQTLFNDFMNVSRETISAVKELEASVRELRVTLIKDGFSFGTKKKPHDPNV